MIGPGVFGGGTSSVRRGQVSVTPEAGVSTSFTNEPAGFVALTDNDWNTLTGDGWSYSGANSTTGNEQTIVTLSGADLPPVNGPQVLRALYQAGSAAGYGTGRTFYTMPAGTDEHFVGLWHKYDADFTGSPISMKMDFWLFDGAGTNRSFFGYEDRPPPDFVVGHAWDGFTSPAGGTNWPAGERFPYGEWYKMEFYFRRNSAPGVQDGIFRVWMDGDLMLELTDMEWPTGDLQMFYHEGTHGGGGSSLDQDQAWYVARTRISVPETP